MSLGIHEGDGGETLALVICTGKIGTELANLIADVANHARLLEFRAYIDTVVLQQLHILRLTPLVLFAELGHLSALALDPGIRNDDVNLSCQRVFQKTVDVSGCLVATLYMRTGALMGFVGSVIFIYGFLSVMRDCSVMVVVHLIEAKLRIYLVTCYALGEPTSYHLLEVAIGDEF